MIRNGGKCTLAFDVNAGTVPRGAGGDIGVDTAH